MDENKTLRRGIGESAWSPNRPQIDPKVIKDDAQNNVKSVDEILKQTSRYGNAGEKKGSKAPADASVDLNKTLLDLNYTIEPSDKFKERVLAQARGYPSVENEKTSDVKNNEALDFSGNEAFVQAVGDRKKEVDDLETDVKRAGLTARELDKKIFEPHTVFNESKSKNHKTMKRLHFKRAFLNEQDVYDRIPEDFKTVGNRFRMRDCDGNEFLIECKEDSYIKGLVHPEIVSAENPEKLNEMFARMDYLTNYKSSDYVKPVIQEDENSAFVDMLECTRSMKKGDSAING